MKVVMDPGAHNQDEVVVEILPHYKNSYKNDGIPKTVFSAWMNYHKQNTALDLSYLNCCQLQMIYMVIT